MISMMVRSVAPPASGMALSSAIMMPTSSVQSWATSPMQLRLFKASVQNGFLIRAASKNKRVKKVPTVSCPGVPALMNTNSVVIRNLLRRALSEHRSLPSLRAAFRTRTQEIRDLCGQCLVCSCGHLLTRHLHTLPPPEFDSVCTQQSMLVSADTHTRCAHRETCYIRKRFGRCSASLTGDEEEAKAVHDLLILGRLHVRLVLCILRHGRWRALPDLSNPVRVRYNAK